MRGGGDHPAVPEGGSSERASPSGQGGCRARGLTTEHQGSAVKMSVDTKRKRGGPLKNNRTSFLSAEVGVIRCPGAREQICSPSPRP